MPQDEDVMASSSFNSPACSLDDDRAFALSLQAVQPGELYAVAIQQNEKVVVAGKAVNKDLLLHWTSVVARFSAGGTLDKSFGSAGFSFGPDLVFNTVSIQSDEKIVAAGNTSCLGAGLIEAVLTRFNRNGAVDATFGNNGIIVTSFFWIQQYERYHRCQGRKRQQLVDRRL